MASHTHHLGTRLIVPIDLNKSTKENVSIRTFNSKITTTATLLTTYYTYYYLLLPTTTKKVTDSSQEEEATSLPGVITEGRRNALIDIEAALTSSGVIVHTNRQPHGGEEISSLGRVVRASNVYGPGRKRLQEV